MHKVVLIQPSTGYWEKVRTKKGGVYIPLSLLCLASQLSGYFEVKIIDERLEVNIENTLRAVLDDSVVLVGLTSFSGAMINSALQLTKLAKKISPHCPIVWGGVLSTLTPLVVIKNPLIDYVIEGEGERSLLLLAAALRDNRDVSTANISGVWYKKRKKAIAPREKTFLNLHLVAPTDYSLIDIRPYIFSYADLKHIAVECSRGCVRQCNYCYNSVVNRKRCRFKSLATVTRELSQLASLKKQYGFNTIFFTDDNLFLNKKFLLSLAKLLKKLGFYWYCQADICALALYTDREWAFLYESGLKEIALGVETASASMRKRLNKQGTTEEIIDFVRKIKKYPIIVRCNYMTNLPEETLEDIKQSIDFMQKLQKENSRVLNNPFFKFSPVPGTILDTALIRNGAYLPPETLEGWSDYSWESKHSPVFSKHLKDKQFFKALVFATMLNDNKIQLMPFPLVLKITHFFYRPVNNFRLQKLFFSGYVELWLFERLFKVFD